MKTRDELIEILVRMVTQMPDFWMMVSHHTDSKNDYDNYVEVYPTGENNVNRVIPLSSHLEQIALISRELKKMKD